MDTDFWKKYILENPMLVDEISEWEVSHFCVNCGGHIPKTHNSLRQKNCNFTHLAMERASRTRCPHCLKHAEYSYGIVLPLETHLKRTRKIYLEPQKKTWWGKKLPRKHFVDIEDIIS